MNHDHAHHEHTHHSHHSHDASWPAAARATAHCLTGCAIGEVLGMIIGTALDWSNVRTVILSVVLAFVFGYALTARHLMGHMALAAALTTALAADTVSIAVMEVIDNAAMLLIPGAMDAHLDSPRFWVSLAIALALAFLAAWPVNRWLIARGQGHALHHHH